MPVSEPGNISPAAHASGTPGPSFAAATTTLLQTMPWGVLALAPNGTVATLNPSAEALWGVPAAAVLGHLPAQVQPAVLPSELLQALAQAAEATQDATYWLPHTQQWISMRTAPATEGGVWVYWDNVTASQQATRLAQKRRAKQRQTRSLLASVEEVTNTGSYQAELATMTFHFSDGMYRLFGEEPGAFTPSLEFIDAHSHPDDIAAVRQVLDQAIAEKRTYHYVRRIYRPDGQLRTLEAHGNVICDKAGRPVKLLGLVQDITERQQAEAEVLRVQQELARRANDQYRALFQAMDQGYFLAEMEFDEQGQAIDILYLDANPAAIRMVGQDFTGRRLKEIDPSYEAYWYEIFGRVARTGVGERLEKFAEPDQKWYDFYIFKVEAEASRRVAVVFQDVTERRRSEQSLLDSEARQSYLLALGDVLHPIGDAVSIQGMVTHTAMRYFQADRCYYGEIDGDTVTIRRDAARPGLPSVAAVYALSTMPLFNAMLRGSQPVVVANVRTSELMDDNLRQLCLDFGILSFINVPIVKNQERVGMFCLTQAALREWTALEIALVQETAERTWSAVERARAKEALRASEEKYRSLFETMDQGFAVCELMRDESGRAYDFRYLELNPAWEQQTGFTRAQALSSTASEMVPNLGASLFETFGQMVETGEPVRFDYYVEPMGRWYHYLAFPQGGQRFACLYDDITARKQAEEVLRQSEERQAYLLRLSDALRPLAEPAAIQREASRVLRAQLGAGQVVYTEAIRPDELQAVATDVAADIPSQLGFHYHKADFGPAIWAELEAGRTHWRDDVTVAPDFSAEEKAVYMALHAPAWANVPLVKDGRLVVMLTVHFPTPHHWTAYERHLLEETAERTWAAAESARAQTALRESEALLQKAFSIDTVGLLFFALDGRMTAANEAFLHMSGYSREALPTMHWETLTAPEFWAITNYAAAELADQGETAPYEKQFVRPDGSRWWGVCAPTRLKGQGPSAECLAFVIDISKRKQAEDQLRVFSASLEQQVAERTQALRESQELLQLIFDTSPLALSVQQAVRDANGDIQDFRVLFLNKELQRELGRTDMVGKRYVQEYPGMKPSGLFDLMCTAVETGEPQHMEYYYPFEGFNRWFSCIFVKLNDGVVATNLDITPRKLAEEKIREQAHFIARVNETLPDLMTVTELPSGQVLYVNRAPDEAPGFEREKLLQVPLQQQTDLLRMHPDDAARLPDYFARGAALADHEITTYGYRAKLNTDQWRWFQVRGSVFQRDPATGAATQLLSVSQDITAQKEAELEQAKSYQLLQQSEEVASLGSWDYDRTTGEFQWSAGMYRLFGMAPGSPISPTTYLDFAIAEDQPVAQRLVQGLTTGRTDFEETLRIQADGAVKTLRVKAVMMLDGAGEPQRVLGVDLDISEVQRLEAENLHMRLTQQQALFRAVLEAQETERRRIAESLHNGLGQTLYATKLQLNKLQTSPAPAVLNRADVLLADAIRQTRTISHELVPTVLSEFGLSAALRDICLHLRGPHLRFECTVELDEQQPLSQPLQVALFRMAQELAQNVVKHAHATEASLALETVPGFVLLRAEDNGVGFSPDVASNTGIGLRTIRDRVALLGGTVDLGSSPEFGTYVRIRFPLPPSSNSLSQ